MKNADMPAMPVRDADNEILRLAHYPVYANGEFATGLTKREMMAMHIHAALLTSQADGVWTGIGVNAAFHAVQEADELLAELERTCQKP